MTKKQAVKEQDRKCETRIKSHMESRLDDLRQLWKAYCDGNEEGVEGLGEIHEYGLSFDYVEMGTFKGQDEGYFRYQLSWGGPSDEFRFYTGPEFHPYRIEYVFMDWFDGATRTLTGKDKALLLEIFDWFNECGSVQAEYDKARSASRRSRRLPW